MKDTQILTFFTNLDLPVTIVLFSATTNPTLKQEMTIIRKKSKSINTKIETSTTVFKKKLKIIKKRIILLVNIL